MRIFNTTDRYIARLMAVPLGASLVITAMLLLLDKMRRLFDFVTQEGGPIGVVWKMLADTIPEYLSLGIPVGLMLGVLLAFRRLAISSELDVYRALGVSYGRLLRVPYVYTAILAFLNLLVVSYIQPYSQYAYQGLRYDLRSGALGASIKVGEFTKIGKGETVRIERSANGGRDLSGIFLHADNSDGKSISVTANKGTFLATDDPDTLIFRLSHGILVNNAPEFKTPRVLSFTSHDLPIKLPKIQDFRQRGSTEHQELTVPELVRIGSTSKGKERNQTLAEFHFRIVQVACMFVIPLLGISLAVPPKRSSSAIGVFLSIFMIVTYYKINQWAAGVAALGKINPVLALWIPFVLFSGLCWWMYDTLAHKPGGQPIGAIERAAARLTKRLTRWFNISRRQPALPVG